MYTQHIDPLAGCMGQTGSNRNQPRQSQVHTHKHLTTSPQWVRKEASQDSYRVSNRRWLCKSRSIYICLPRNVRSKRTPQKRHQEWLMGLSWWGYDGVQVVVFKKDAVCSWYARGAHRECTGQHHWLPVITNPNECELGETNHCKRRLYGVSTAHYIQATTSITLLRCSQVYK